MWKFKLRMARARWDTAATGLASAAELDQLVTLQAAYWRHNPPLVGSAAQRALTALNHRSASAFVCSVRGGRVQLWPKPASGLGQAAAVHRHEQQVFRRRARMYRAFIEATLRHSGATLDLDFALDVNDMPADAADVPIFSFQKLRGAHNPLLPDVDFFHSRWYRDDRDSLRYEDKTATACFVGASTGDWLTVVDIRHHQTPRLRAAAHFQGDPRVVFKIAKAVHCLTEEARAELLRQPYFSAYVPWQDQLRHRFILSMDGNGAACSRLVKGLRSNSVVVKFESPYELYYFAALRPGRDLLQANDEADLQRILDDESASPGTYQAVARGGQLFAQKYLTIRSVMAYTAGLLSAFAALSRA